MSTAEVTPVNNGAQVKSIKIQITDEISFLEKLTQTISYTPKTKPASAATNDLADGMEPTNA